MANHRAHINDERSIAGKLLFCARLAIALTVGVFLGGHASAQTYVVKDGTAKSVIVVQDGAQGLYRRSAEELQKYVGELTGARPEIIAPRDISGRAKDEALLVVGGPEANELVKKAAQAGTIDFSNLKPEGFLLKTIKIGDRPALVIGGKDEAGTFYGTYDWLERQGIAFQISGDIIPQTKNTLALDELDVRSEPAFVQRGFGIASCYETRSIWSYPDIVKFIDQMAKLKLNYLIWHMFSPEPYLDESFQGERKLMGDEASWEGGYTLPAFNFGTHKVQDYFVGKEAFEKFDKKYMAPNEWQGVRDPDQVHASAKDLLQRVIKYAKSRNIKVWVALESLDELSPNLARYTRRPNLQLPYAPYHGAYACPADENLSKINEVRFKLLLQNYPEAEGFIFWMNEGYPVCDDKEDQDLVKSERSQYAGVPGLIDTYYKDVARFQKTDLAVANSIGSVHLVQKIVELRNQISPNTKIGIGLWGRAYLLPTLDKVLPKDVLIVDNETGGVWTPGGVPMQLYGGMGDRDRIFMHVGDDDTGMIGMQFHVRLYYRDRMLEGALENGVAGVTELGDRFRGEEQLAKYMADGAWNPHLTPDQFYHDYARHIFGQRAEGSMVQAFMSLEDMEGYKGYHNNKPDHLELMACCSPPEELKVAQEYSEQPNPYDGPAFKNWDAFVNLVPEKIALLSDEVALERQALGFMKTAEATAAPGSLDELHYLENKTEAYSQMIEAFIQFDQACLTYNSAFQFDRRTQRQEFVTRVDESLLQFDKARITGRSSAETWSKVVDNVSDLGVLWRLNTFVVSGMDVVAQFMQNIDNYHHGKFYLNPVPWDRVFSPLPIITKRTGFEGPTGVPQ